jgi:16S rRNA (uracil1498-N3)-methyltransferase
MAGVFYFPELGESERTITLVGEEARHAVAVRRIRVGEEISITNGQGLIATCDVVSIANKPPSLDLSIRELKANPAPRTVHLAAAMPKGDRQRVLLDMVTQVGISEFTPLLCERSVSRENEKAQERWQRICLEAMKQSRRAWLPNINPSVDLTSFIDSLPKDRVLCCASAEGQDILGMTSIESEVGIAIVVGPEGGFTENEIGYLQKAGALEFNLGDGILRTETAAVVAAALIRLLHSK